MQVNNVNSKLSFKKALTTNQQKDFRETIKKRSMVVAGSAVEVVPAKLGNTAGVIGASLLIES